MCYLVLTWLAASTKGCVSLGHRRARLQPGRSSALPKYCSGKVQHSAHTARQKITSVEAQPPRDCVLVLLGLRLVVIDFVAPEAPCAASRLGIVDHVWRCRPWMSPLLGA
eukprot:695170-Rhodomonas_salina.1